jgi:hypothetical protein
MATPTYDLLASVAITTTTSGVTISNINTIGAGYRDLVLVVNSTSTSSVAIRINGDSAANYSYVNAEGVGSTAYSRSVAGDDRYAPNYYTYSDGVSILQFFDFSQTDKHKSILSRTNSKTQGVNMAAGRWANTTAITSISDLGTRNAGDTYHLYGIAG